jgi:hypothetical protein
MDTEVSAVLLLESARVAVIDCDLGHSLEYSSEILLAERSVGHNFISMGSVMAICHLAISRQQIACEAGDIDGRH